MKKNIKIFNLSLALALVFSVLLSTAGFAAQCQELRDNVLRLHIIANSNSEDDQALKLQVRDALLEQSDSLFGEAETLDEAVELAKKNVSVIKETAETTVKAKGYNYPVSVKLEESFFGTRVYDEFTLPAGVYDALKIEIGDAEGKNWWCVLFPGICIGASRKLDGAVDGKAAAVAEGGSRFTVRFKIIEIYETVKNRFCR